MELVALILAAGQGTRMRSALPKVMHPLAGQPIIKHVLNAVQPLSSQPPVVVIGHGADAVRDGIGTMARFVIQEKQLGTAHAVLSAAQLLGDFQGHLLVLSGDMPLLTTATLRQMLEYQQTCPEGISMLTVMADDPRGFGRIVRSADGGVQAIVEEAQATPEQRKIRELNTSAYCFSAEWLWGALRRVPLSPKGEYYLTDVIGIAVVEGRPVKAFLLSDPAEAIGINTRVHLAEAEAVLRKRTNTAWMLSGVTLIHPETTYIEAGVQIGADTVIWPNTYLRGNTVIGQNCEIGPDTIIEDTRIGNHCTVLKSVLEGAVLEDDVDMGPWAHLRKGAYLCSHVHMGNFGEIKNSRLSEGVKMGHFSYIGDARIGTDVNIGAGTITCNYDGERKHPTEIGANAFIGSDTMLVAPVKIGEGARTGAGAVVTHDVPDHTVVVGVPARPLKKTSE